MAIIIAGVLFVFLAIVISMFGYKRYAKPGRFFERLGSEAVVDIGAHIDLTSQPTGNAVVKIFQLIGEHVPISPQDVSLRRRFLIAAGFRSDLAVRVFYGIKVVLCITLFAAAFVFRNQVSTVPMMRIMLLIGGAGMGFFIPNIMLEKMMDKRQERLRLSLPDALDLLVVSVEAGLGLDQAMLNVSRELITAHKELSEELRMVMLEMRAGKRRIDALRNLAERTGEAELRKLVAILVQTDRFGTSIADSLRTHSDFMRVRRKQQAEERAGKVGVKLVFPIFFFILPAMLIVAAGPGILQLFKHLFPLMKTYAQ
jgi:tight adherence protein C